MSKYIDIHTHQHGSADIEVITNTYPDFHRSDYTTIGIHPWHAEDMSIEQIDDCLDHYLDNQCWAYGEIGLDRRHYASWAKQLEFFKIQLDRIKKDQIKRVIIHNVRATSDILPLIKDHKSCFLWHDFRDNEQAISQVLGHTHSFFSFGISLFNSKKTKAVFKHLDINRVFLETDDADIPIQEVYHKACEIKGIDINQFKNAIYKNWLVINSK